MVQKKQNERISDWMSLIEDTSVSLNERGEGTDALYAQVKLRMSENLH